MKSVWQSRMSRLMSDLPLRERCVHRIGRLQHADKNKKTWMFEYLRITTPLFYLFNSTCYFLFSDHSFLVHLLFVPEWQTKILNYRTFTNLWVFFSQAFLGLYLCMCAACSTAHTSLSSSEHLGNWKSSQVVHLNLAILRLGRVDSGMAAFKYSSLLITAEAGPFNLWSLAAGPPGHTLNTQGCSP